ncbi:Uncharacterized protein Rs2_06772 [Raphanus sativus]|nr:Uncharacterized protein Rs2_06772 [Raphanus sativus]
MRSGGLDMKIEFPHPPEEAIAIILQIVNSHLPSYIVAIPVCVLCLWFFFYSSVFKEIINIPAKLCGLKCLIYEISDSFFLPPKMGQMMLLRFMRLLEWICNRIFQWESCNRSGKREFINMMISFVLGYQTYRSLRIYCDLDVAAVLLTSKADITNQLKLTDLDSLVLRDSKGNTRDCQVR